MAIYRMTYLSGEFRVKAYLGLPPLAAGLEGDLQTTVTQLFGEPDRFPIERLTSDLNGALYQAGKLPAIVYCRGGIGRVGRVRTEWIQDFINMGYVAMAPCYRGNEGGEGRDEFGGVDCEDVHSAVRFLQSLEFVDRDRISVLGFSRGSINATRTAVEVPNVSCLVLWGGVSDLARTYEERVDLRRMLRRVISGTPTRVPDAYSSRSPVCLASRIPCPILIIHGDADAQVDYSHGVRMFETAKLYNRMVNLHGYYQMGHHMDPLIRQAIIARMLDFVGAVETTEKP